MQDFKPVYQFLLIIILHLFVNEKNANAQNFFMVQGYVVDDNADPIAGVTIRNQGTQLGTISDIDGKYELKLEEGFYRIAFTHVGYESKIIEISVNRNQIVNVNLKPLDNTLIGVEIKASNKGMGWQIMQKVINQKTIIQEKQLPYKMELYVKNSEKIVNTPKAVNNNKIKNPEEEDDILDKKDDEKDKKDTMPSFNLFESIIIHYASPPKKMKEERTAVKKIGSQLGLFYTTSVRGEINLYENYIYIPKVGDKTFVSPLNNNANVAYKFKLQGSYIDSSLGKVYRIKVTPRGLSNATFDGELQILENNWQLYTADLEIHKRNMLSYDAFSIKQTYQWIDSQMFIQKQQFEWSEKQKNTVFEGKANIHILQLTTDTTYPPKFFGAELGRTNKDAYEKDTGFWAEIRPEKLTLEEQIFVDKSDSLQRVRNSKEYLDSVDAEYNAITMRKILWDGVTRINREKEVRWNFGSLPNLIRPVAIGGPRINYGLSYYKRFKDRKNISINPNIHYGLRNEDFKGSLFINSLYNPLKRGYAALSFGRDFGVVNGFATLTDIARRDNFYEKNFLRLGHSRELFNGFYLGVSGRYEARNDLGNFKFDQRFDSIFGDINSNSAFKLHNAFHLSAYISYTPKQLYVMEPNEKVIIGSRYPTFELVYKRAIPNFFGSTINFDRLTFEISQEFNVGIMGVSEYRLSTAKFFNLKDIEPMDYIWQRGGDPYIFGPAMYTYQLIDRSFPVFDFYFESHYEHRFNGFLTSKVPLLNKLGLRESAGGGILYVPEEKYRYEELFIGVNRVFKIGRNFMRFGIYYIVAESNTVGFRSGFKFAISPYDRANNTWSF